MTHPSKDDPGKHDGGVDCPGGAWAVLAEKRFDKERRRTSDEADYTEAIVQQCKTPKPRDLAPRRWRYPPQTQESSSGKAESTLSTGHQASPDQAREHTQTLVCQEIGRKSAGRRCIDLPWRRQGKNQSIQPTS